MKRLSHCLSLMGVVLLALFMLSACASTPQPQLQQGQTPGQYKNDEYRFTADYPDHYLVQALEGDDVFRAANPNAWKIPVFNVTVADAEAGAALDANVWIASAQKATPGSKRFKILSEKMVTLNDGTPGLALTYKWTFSDGATKLQTASLWVIKNGKSISANATTILGGDTKPDTLLEMVSSIKFF
jgi:hypothetical protein